MLKQTILPAIQLFFILTLLTGVIYPLTITLGARVIFPFQATGSLLTVHGQKIGSALIGQTMNEPLYFWPRPSVIDYNPLPSGGSNLGLTSATLQATVQQRRADIQATYGLPADAQIPNDLLFASGSGLDPHISPAAARLQIDRVAKARHLSNEQRVQLSNLVERSIEPPQFWLLGQPRVNVLRLNLGLDEMR